MRNTKIQIKNVNTNFLTIFTKIKTYLTINFRKSCMWRKIIRYLSRKTKKPFFINIGDSKKLIKFAFNIGGNNYYMFANPMDMPVGRWHYSNIFNDEMLMAISRESLIEMSQMLIDATNEGDLVTCGKVAWEINYRAKTLYDTEQIYKLASVTFFSLSEDLTTYDFDFNAEKIANFKSEKMKDFFGNAPMKTLLPFGATSEEDLVQLLVINELKMESHNLRMNQMKKEAKKPQ